MNSIKGLIQKDIYIGRKTLVTFGGIFVLMIILMFLFRFAFIYGNLADASFFEDEDSREFSMRYFDIIFPVVASLATLIGFDITNQQSLESDLKCRWLCYAFSCGVAEKNIVCAKHIENLTSVILPAAVNAVLGAVYCVFFNNGDSALGAFAGAVLLPLLVGILSCIETTLLFMLRRLQTVQIIIMAAIFAAVFGMVVKFIPEIEKMSEDPAAMLDSLISRFETYKGAITAVFIAAYLLIWSAAFLINTKLLKRREKICGD